MRCELFFLSILRTVLEYVVSVAPECVWRMMQECVAGLSSLSVFVDRGTSITEEASLLDDDITLIRIFFDISSFKTCFTL